MTRKSNNRAGTFSALLSANDEARQIAYATRQKETGLVDSPEHGANAKPSEETALERRVLAHQRILQALICDLADDDPAIFERLNVRFGVGHDLGSYEQDYVTTGHYCEHFLGSVEQRHSPRPVTNPKIAIAFERQKVRPLDGLGSRQVASDRGQREEWENEGGSFAVPLTPPRNACFSIFRADRVMLTSTRPAGGDWRWKLRASTGALIAKGSGFSTEKECLAAVTFLKDNSQTARIFIE